MPYPIRAWLGLGVLVIFSIFSYADRQIVALLVDPIKASLTITDTEISLAQGTAFWIFYSLAGFPIGAAVDKFSKKFILFLGVVIFGLASASCGLASGFGSLFFCRTIVGIGEAVITPIALSIISEMFPKGRHAFANGIFGMAAYAGQGISLFVGGMLFSALSQSPLSIPFFGAIDPWRATFILTGLPAVTLACLAFSLPAPRQMGSTPVIPSKGPALARKTRVGGYRGLFIGRGKVLLYGLTGFSTLSIVMNVSMAWLPTFFVRHYAWKPEDIGWAVGVIICFGGVVGSVGFGRILSWFVEKGNHGIYFSLPAITFLAALPLLCTSFWINNAVTSLVLFGIGFVLITAQAPAAYSFLQIVVPSDMRGKMAAIYVFLGALVGGALAPLLVAVLTDYVFSDPKQIGDAIVSTILALVPLGCLTLLLGQRELIAIVTRDALQSSSSNLTIAATSRG